jgi:hypothetical protein
VPALGVLFQLCVLLASRSAGLPGRSRRLIAVLDRTSGAPVRASRSAQRLSQSRVRVSALQRGSSIALACGVAWSSPARSVRRSMGRPLSLRRRRTACAHRRCRVHGRGIRRQRAREGRASTRPTRGHRRIAARARHHPGDARAADDRDRLSSTARAAVTSRGGRAAPQVARSCPTNAASAVGCACRCNQRLCMRSRRVRAARDCGRRPSARRSRTRPAVITAQLATSPIRHRWHNRRTS